jgi:hypothetical protein
MVKYYTALLDKLISKRQGKLSNIILFLQDKATPNKAAITHQKLADIHFEVLQHPAYSAVWPLWTTASFLTSRNSSREESF